MAKFIINGGRKLNGIVRVMGAKNAILPILAAALLSNRPVTIHDCPNLIDVENMIRILKSIGCKVIRDHGSLYIDPSILDYWEIPDRHVKEIRSSIVILGAVLGRMKKAKITYPGGCEIGQRPINLHLKGLKQLGVQINESHGYLECMADKLQGAEVHLDYPSVGATENIMLAAVRAKGVTCIHNAAKEPEIVDLQNFINALGGKVKGAGGSTIVIEGTDEFKEIEYTVIPDRIVAGTYMIAAGITGGDILVKNIVFDHVQSLVNKLREMGCMISPMGNREVRIKAPNELYGIDYTKTLPYPGFPTDMQAQLMSILGVAHGTSIVTETIFESRYKHVPELIRMGANIRIHGQTAVIQGIKAYKGAEVRAWDLRGGAALVIAGLNAEGTTIIDNISHIDRGYDNLERDLHTIGADIIRV